MAGIELPKLSSAMNKARKARYENEGENNKSEDDAPGRFMPDEVGRSGYKDDTEHPFQRKNFFGLVR